MEIRSATISYSKTQAYFRKEYENELHNRFEILDLIMESSPSDETRLDFETVKDELLSINALKTEGHRIRSKAEFIEYNERAISFFFNLEKRNSAIKNITKLKIEQSKYALNML